MALQKVGALWEKQGAKGPYFSGEVNGQKILVFKNDHKKPGEKFPDYEIHVRTEDGEHN